MDEEARRAVEDALGNEDEHETVTHAVLRRVLMPLTSVVDRHKEESDEGDQNIAKSSQATNKLAIALGSVFIASVVGAILTNIFR